MIIFLDHFSEGFRPLTAGLMGIARFPKSCWGVQSSLSRLDFIILLDFLTRRARAEPRLDFLTRRALFFLWEELRRLTRILLGVFKSCPKPKKGASVSLSTKTGISMHWV